MMTRYQELKSKGYSDLKCILIDRDELAPDEADELIELAREQVMAGEDPEEVLLNDFGLEPDYFFDLLEGLV